MPDEALPKKKLVFIAAGSFICAIGIFSRLPSIVPDKIIAFACLTAAVAAATLLRKRKAAFFAALALIFFLLGAWRFSLSEEYPKRADNILALAGQQALIAGIIQTDGTDASKGKSYAVKSLSSGGRHYSGSILLYSNFYPLYRPGDLISFNCRLKQPESFTDFDYAGYLAAKGIYAICYYPEVLQVSAGQGPASLLSKARSKAARVLDSALKEPEAAIANAMLLGDSGGIPEDIRLKYSKSGLAHLIAISGLHFSLLTVIILNSLMRCGLSRKGAFYAIIFFLLTYTALIGFRASAIRAALMGFLVLWAMQLGRLNNSFRALLLVCALNLAINPLLLIHDIGFQLSYVSTAGIILLLPAFKYFREKSGLGSSQSGWQNNALVSMAAYIPTVPIIAHHFGILSLVSLVSNLFVLAFFPFILAGLFIALFITLLVSKIAYFAFIIPALMLKWMNLAAEIFSFSEYFYLTISRMNILIWIFYYIILALIIYYYYSKIREKIEN